ncbi:MAG TPA: AraC family transcriptional regulator [Chitinophagales bacterium]
MQLHQLQHNILYACVGEHKPGFDPFVPIHSLGFIISGFMEIYTENGVQIVGKGTIGLVKRNQLLKATKKPDGEKPFKLISIFFTEEILKAYSIENDVKANSIYTGDTYLALPNDPFLNSYFDSLMPYFDQPDQLTASLAKAKTNEAIALLLRNPALKNFLFDFSEPHKIDLEAYMNRHFSYNVPLAKFAKLTGRSLSTFKRDFEKIFRASPEKWLQKRRLEMAHFLISQKDKRPSDVYLEVGFENFSHFSTAFKKEFGVNASSVIK